MRRLVMPLALLSLVAVPASADQAPAASGSDMPWETSYSAALKKAEADRKPILFDFHTGWCPHCTRMDKTTWKDADLVKLATGSFVVAKINADVEKAPVSRYRLVGYPTVIVAEPGGDPVLRLEGYKDAAAITATIKAYLGSADSLKDAFATLRTDKKNPDALLVVGGFYDSVGLHDQAADTLLKAVKGSSGPALVRVSSAAGNALVAAGKPDEARKVLTQGLTAAGDAPPAGLLLALGNAENASGHADQARGWYSRIVKDYPGTIEAAEAARALGTVPSG